MILNYIFCFFFFLSICFHFIEYLLIDLCISFRLCRAISATLSCLSGSSLGNASPSVCTRLCRAASTSRPLKLMRSFLKSLAPNGWQKICLFTGKAQSSEVRVWWLFMQHGFDMSVFLISSSGLFPLLGHASMAVKPVLLKLYERYYLPLQRALLPSLQAFITGLLPGLEEGLEVYDRFVLC